jgi:large subunit ribosomal protein L10
MALTRKQKDALIESVASTAKDASLIVLTSYQGIDVETDTRLRAEIRKSGGRYQVVKNSLARKVLAGDEFADLRSHMKGMTGYVFGGEDPVATAKVLTKFAKDHEAVFQIKSGFFEGRTLSTAQVDALAKTPGRKELLARLASALKSPIQKLANVLRAPIQKLAGTIQALADKKAEPGAPVP